MREPLQIEKRKPFSASDKHAIVLRQSTNGIARCDVCNEPIAFLSPDGHWIKQRPYDFDHEIARTLGGRTDLKNGRAICAHPFECHKAKSADDAWREHKAIRQGGGAGSQWARRQARKAAGERAPIPNRGFERKW